MKEMLSKKLREDESIDLEDIDLNTGFKLPIVLKSIIDTKTFDYGFEIEPVIKENLNKTKEFELSPLVKRRKR